MTSAGQPEAFESVLRTVEAELASAEAEVRELLTRRDALQRRASLLRNALTHLSSMSFDRDKLAAEQAWREDLCRWRESLTAELSEARSALRSNLEQSLAVIDGHPYSDVAVALTRLRLGELMRESGYEPLAESDHRRNLPGTMPWRGSLPETDARIQRICGALRRSQDVVDAALLDDAARASLDAQTAAYREVIDGLRLKLRDEHLVPVDRRGEPIDLATLSEVQRDALARANREWSPHAALETASPLNGTNGTYV
jgi:hypothetical protein